MSPGRRGVLAEVLEHQRCAPDGAGGVRDALAGDVRRRAVHGLEHARHVGARSDVRAGRHAHAALDGGREVGEDVAEEVRCDDDVEAAGIAHHAARPARPRAPARRARRRTPPPSPRPPRPRARSRTAKRSTSSRCQRPASGGRELERIAHDSPHPGAREDARLQRDLGVEPPVRAAADARVLALGVLADEERSPRPRGRARRAA